MAKNPLYCPICAHPLATRHEGGRMRPVCENCGYVHYVNPIPGVGLVIEMDGGVVLVKRGHPPHKGEWTLPSGFVEADESAEEAAIREAEEETGLKVEIIELAGINSFPEGPPVSGIMIFYRLKPIGGTLRAGDDAEDVRVFQPHDIPVLPFRTHREMMAQWLERFHSSHHTQPSLSHPTTFNVRSAEISDIEEITSLLALIPANRQLSDEDWQTIAWRLREMSGVEVFVAVTQEQPMLIIGCIALTIARGLTEGVGLINDMAVLPTYQRRGVGAGLLEAVMRRAVQLNLRSLWVNTQRANDQARAFYAALGFSEIEIMRLKIR